MLLVKCPDCLKEISECNKKWKYGQFDVEAFSCECGTDFRSYKKGGVESFKLKRKKSGGKFRKP
jgi:hypothetical protein